MKLVKGISVLCFGLLIEISPVWAGSTSGETIQEIINGSYGNNIVPLRKYNVSEMGVAIQNRPENTTLSESKLQVLQATGFSEISVLIQHTNPIADLANPSTSYSSRILNMPSNCDISGTTQSFFGNPPQFCFDFSIINPDFAGIRMYYSNLSMFQLVMFEITEGFKHRTNETNYILPIYFIFQASAANSVVYSSELIIADDVPQAYDDSFVTPIIDATNINFLANDFFGADTPVTIGDDNKIPAFNVNVDGKNYPYKLAEMEAGIEIPQVGKFVYDSTIQEMLVTSTSLIEKTLNITYSILDNDNDSSQAKATLTLYPNPPPVVAVSTAPIPLFYWQSLLTMMLGIAILSSVIRKHNH